MSAPRNAPPAILDYWRKLEFFIPYDAQGAWEQDGEKDARFYSLRDLLHYSRQDFWAGKVRNDHVLQGFDLYLNIYPQQAIVDEMAALLKGVDENESEKIQEYYKDSCFARIKADAKGVLQIDTLEVSSAPWAIGHLRHNNWQGLDFDAFEADVETLRAQLQGHLQSHSLDKAFWGKQLLSLGGRYAISGGLDMGGIEMALDWLLDALPGEGEGERIVHGQDLLLLVELLHQWSGGFHPPAMRANEKLIAIKPLWKKIPQEKKLDNDDAASDDEAPENGAGGILNSFYGSDLATIIKAMREGERSAALDAYLGAGADHPRVDLYDAAGFAAIAARLQPQFLNHGRWPEQPEYVLSLMQQFAVNTIFHDEKAAPLFSVNGSPGTGKTTLLRDIFAENIVRRAGVLAGLTCAQAAFSGEKSQIPLKNDMCTLSHLNPELTGFEMVVVSSNNAAVENITRDLPKRSALGKDFQDWPGYLQTVAENYFAQEDGKYIAPDEKDRPWGFFSCALGNSPNRKKFIDGLFFVGKNKKGYDPARHQGFWDWRNSPYPLSFAEAQRDFREVKKQVKARVTALQRHAEMVRHHAAHQQHLARVLQDAEQAEKVAHAAYQTAEQAQQAAQQQLEVLMQNCHACQHTIESHAFSRPAWWVRLFGLPSARRWQAQQRLLQQALADARAAWHSQKSVCLQREGETHSAQQAYADGQRVSQAAREACVQYQSDFARQCAQFPEAQCPPNSAALNEDEWQINGLWRDTELNRLRAELFARALTLHEAWLHEAKAFAGNAMAIGMSLKGKIRYLPPKQALAIWQSLFMIVPVISSTFASFARQFGNLGAQSLGFVIIDEAGQALPQAAAGALWRAKRAIAVGDPLQIEPVFTTPAKLANQLEEHDNLTPEHDVSPVRVSVQSLADRANPFGANLPQDNGQLWVGSPLRVHRRCVDPMFSIANRIAYQNKMIFFAPHDPDKRKPPQEGVHPGESAWVQCAGQTGAKQYVPAQGELVCQALRALYQRSGKLPALYIITPFRKVRDELQALMRRDDFWRALPAEMRPKKKAWHAWIKDRIGTVHTFQGKEESMVWLVLGCDDNSAGAAGWAAEKPNLLNVALTRAKHRIFIIGDRALWGRKRYFDDAYNSLPQINAETFLQRAAG